MSIIENYLKEKLDGFKEIEAFQKHFDEMAKYILGNVAIVIGDSNSKQIKYYLEEIEFYYNNLSTKIIDSIKGNEITDEEKNKIHHFSCTYKRDKKAGQLFWHYSGVDICFQSYMKQNCYGGILIRSISKHDDEENNTELIAGPLRCANEIANQSINLNSIPHIEEIKGVKRNICVNDIASTIRQGIETTKRYNDIKEGICNEDDRKASNFPFFCYFIKRKEEEWKKAKYGSIPEKRANYIRPLA